MSRSEFTERRRIVNNVSKGTTKDDFEIDRTSNDDSSQNTTSKHIIPTPPSSPMVLMTLPTGHSGLSCSQQQYYTTPELTTSGIDSDIVELKPFDIANAISNAGSRTKSDSSASKYKTRNCQYFAPELLYKILSYFSSSQSSLQVCALVCKQWSLIACTILWRRPMFTSLGSVDRFISALSIDTPLNPELWSPSPPNSNPPSSSSSNLPIPSMPSAPLMLTTDNYELFTLSTHPNTINTAITVHRYAPLVRVIDFTQLDEVHRNSATLSQYLVRLIPILQANLQTLDLGFSKGVRNFDLQRLSPWLSNLTSLNLAGGGRTDIVLAKLSKHCPKLVRLSVSWNSQLTDFGFVEMARHCRELRALDLTNCAQISDTGVMALAVYCTQLKVLNVSYCQCVGEVAIWELARSCKQLKLINALGCINLSRGFPDELRIKYPELLVNVAGILPFYYPDIA